MRLYTDVPVDDPQFSKICALACNNPLLDICHVKDLPGTPGVDEADVFPMVWRFFPALDPQVTDHNLTDHNLPCRLNDKLMKYMVKLNTFVTICELFKSHSNTSRLMLF